MDVNKRIDEILTWVLGYPRQDDVADNFDYASKLFKALIKEVVTEVVGEDEVRPVSGPKRNGIEQGLRRTRNRLRADIKQSLERILK